MKRILSVFLSMVMLLSITAGLTMTASAQTEKLTIGKYECLLNESEEITVIGYTGNLSEVGIPSELNGYTVVGIGSNAFENNTSICEVIIPKTVKVIADYAFFGCNKLETVIFDGPGIETIAYKAFAGTVLKDIYFKGTEAQWNAIHVQYDANAELAVAKKHFGINGVAGDFSYEVLDNPRYVWITGYTGNATKVTVPKELNGLGVKGIGEKAFANNDKIVEVTLPDTVEVVRDYGFYFCKNLKAIHFGKNISDIGMYAFRGCKNLKDVYYNGTKEQWAKVSIINGEDDGNIELLKATMHYGAAAKAQWIKSGSRWWYKHADGSYTKNNWEKIDGKWYHFDKSGWMQTGWIKVSNKWYYLNKSGAMTTGWQKVSNKWYYMNSSGAMLTGWQKVSNKWYYMNSSGAMQTGWVKLSNKWYYMNSSGVMQTGWQKIGGAYYHFNASGVMSCNQKVGSYYVDKNGRWVR